MKETKKVLGAYFSSVGFAFLFQVNYLFLIVLI